jgi:hypothetical protein
VNRPLPDRRVGTASGRPWPAGAAGWLPLAAAPSFLAMAVVTGQGSAPDMLCMAPDASPLTGMVPMYLLMSVFHAAPWLTLFASRRGGNGRNERCRPFTNPGDVRA